MFIALLSTCIQNFSNQLFPFAFLSHSVALGVWSGIQRVEPQMIYFELFLSPGTQEPLLHFDPTEQHFFTLGSWKKCTLSIHPKKINIPAPIQSNAFVSLYKFETSWSCLADSAEVLLVSLGPLTFAFHETALDLACYLLWELSRCVLSFVSNLLQNYFSRCIQDYQSSPSFFFSSKPSFLDDHYFTTQHSDFSSF